MARTFLDLELEGLPPTINNYYGRSGYTVYKRTQARHWQEQAVSLLSEHWGSKPPYPYPVEFMIIYQSPKRRKWDIDNRIKPLQDCLELAGIIKNDRQVESLHVRREYAPHRTEPATRIILMEYKGEQA